MTRPRGLDRDELDSRIRGRRVDTPYRRGGYADEPAAGGYAPFEPEPEDALAQRGEPDGPRPYVDNVRDEAPPAPPPAGDPWRRGREVPPPGASDMEEEEEALQKAQAERQGIALTDRFELHSLGREVIEKIISKLTYYDEIVAIMRKG